MQYALVLFILSILCIDVNYENPRRQPAKVASAGIRRPSLENLPSAGNAVNLLQ